MKALKIFGIVIGSIVALVIILVVVVWILISRPSGIAAQVTPVASTAEASQSLDNKWNDFSNTVNQSKKGTQVSVTLTQEEVTSKINDAVKTVALPSGLTVGKMSVNLTAGKILLAADAKYLMFSAHAGMSAVVNIVNGQPLIVVTNIDMGSLPIPQSMKDQLKGLIPADTLIKTGQMAFEVQNVQIDNGQMVISGVKR